VPVPHTLSRGETPVRAQAFHPGLYRNVSRGHPLGFPHHHHSETETIMSEQAVEEKAEEAQEHEDGAGAEDDEAE